MFLYMTLLILNRWKPGVVQLNVFKMAAEWIDFALANVCDRHKNYIYDIMWHSYRLTCSIYC